VSISRFMVASEEISVCRLVLIVCIDWVLETAVGIEQRNYSCLLLGLAPKSFMSAIVIEFAFPD